MSKQAVLLIHGIGEQLPMETLRGFVKTVWTTADDVHENYDGSNVHWSKPYRLSDSFELRLILPLFHRTLRRLRFELI